MTMVYDAIVVGAGVEGSYTAYHLAKDGKKTLLLEQFPLPHSRGSSAGHSRITRKAYPQDFYVRMMKEAYQLWEQLETEADSIVYRKTGMLAVGKANGQFLVDIEHAIRTTGESCQVLSPDSLRENYPMLKYPDDFGAVFDGVAGVLLADKALASLHKVFVQNGGEIRSEEEMVNLFPGETITVRTRKGAYKTRSVVLCVGPWASKILKPLGLHLPLKPIRVAACYWRERKAGVYSLESGFPTVIDGDVGDGEHVYGLPSMEYPGHTKLCWHNGPIINPDARDDVIDESFVEATARYAREHFPGLEAERPSIKEMCSYTMTPDAHPVLDTHPHWTNIVVGVGFSGHGFKLSPVVGKILADLASGRPPAYDLSPFTIKRFHHKAAL